MTPRRHKRHPIFGTAVISADSIGSLPLETVIAIANISQSGLGLYSYTSLEKGTTVTIKISFRSTRGRLLQDTVRGDVIWSTKEGNLYFTGIAFNGELNPQDQPFLYEHFCHLQEQKD